jgi:hypothetical protein
MKSSFILCYPLQVIHEKKRPSFPFRIHTDYITIVEECWSHKPDDRPTFQEIAERLANMRANIPGDTVPLMPYTVASPLRNENKPGYVVFEKSASTTIRPLPVIQEYSEQESSEKLAEARFSSQGTLEISLDETSEKLAEARVSSQGTPEKSLNHSDGI